MTRDNEAMEALYPFLYADTSDLSAVLAQVRASTVAKAEEILELRRTVCARDGARLA
jgi:D-sedoheptulose 7-phosphate isomerase